MCYLRFFDKLTYVESFRDGNLRMMSAHYYKTYQNLHIKSHKMYDERFDFYENSLALLLPDNNGEAKFGNHKIKIYPEQTLLEPIVCFSEKLDKQTKIYCMYMLSKKDVESGVFKKFLDNISQNTWEYYCLIIDSKAFGERLKRVSNSYDYTDFVYGSANYVDEHTYNGCYGSFTKPKGLSEQNEFRIKLKT